MKEEMEFEAKALVTKKQYDTLLQLFNRKNNEGVVQYNYYFETPSLQLKQAKASLRIRKKNNSYTFTLKQPRQNGILELNEPISENEATDAITNHQLPSGHIYDTLLTLPFNIDQLSYIGQLKTERISFQFENGTLFFDKNYYFDIVDYEVEFEGVSEAHANDVLSNMLLTYGMEAETAPPKIYRFLKWQQQRKQ